MVWDGLDLFEAGWLLFGFWRFVLSRSYRTRVLHKWREASTPHKWLGVLEAVIATVVGLGIPILVVYLLLGAAS